MKIKKTNINSLYVHIPFCAHICYYCDFTKVIYQKAWIKKYLEALKRDLKRFSFTDFKTVYVGGGTPTSLDVEEHETLLEILEPYTKTVFEYTFEANVENLTREKLVLLKKYGVNRLSIGVQTFNDEMLKEIGRVHTGEEAVEKVRLASEVGFKNINIDLMFALPGQTLDDVKCDLDIALTLPITHLSSYSLILNPHTIAAFKKWVPLDNDEEANMYVYTSNRLQNAGFNHYEVSNFAKNGYESLHNLTYWHNEEYVGVGYGASGYVNRRRYTISGSFRKYLEGEINENSEIITDDLFKEEYLILHLRLKEGISLKNYEETFSEKFPLNSAEIRGFLDEKLLVLEGDSLHCTTEGFLKLDMILRALI
jgi:oxygen-independent coproporphyrinogen-3 oxidase